MACFVNIKKSEKTKILFLVLLAYCICNVLLFYYLGHFNQLEEIFSSQKDAQGYLRIAGFLVGKNEVPPALLLRLRPFFYPLVLSIYYFVGTKFYIILQGIFNLITISALFLSACRLFRSTIPAVVVVFLIVLHPTFSFIVLHALCESLALALVSISIFLIIKFLSEKRNIHLFATGFFLCLSACTKPVYLPLAFLWLIYSSIFLWRKKALRSGTLRNMVISLSPLLIQLTFTTCLLGSPTVSTAASHNFEKRFFYAVYGFSTTGKMMYHNGTRKKEADLKYPTLKEKTQYVVGHPVATIQAIAFLVNLNLKSPTSIVKNLGHNKKSERDVEKIIKYSRILNKIFYVVHVFGLLTFLILIAVDRKNDDMPMLLFLAFTSYMIWGTSALTYWQGDRLIIAALPAWPLMYAIMMKRISVALPRLKNAVSLYISKRF